MGRDVTGLDKYESAERFADELDANADPCVGVGEVDKP
jgi:hypothetical protein